MNSCRGDHFHKHRAHAKTVSYKTMILNHGLIIGTLSLVWLILKTGRKPSRINYPCQQTALANISLFLLPPLGLIGHRVWSALRHRLTRAQLFRLCCYVALCATLAGSLYAGWQAYSAHKQQHQPRLQGPVGKLAPAALGLAAGTFLTIPHAMALPSHHRVVSVHDANATSWSFPCTGGGSCAQYYGDSDHVDQNIVDQMVALGVKTLTGQENLSDAWHQLIPDYQSGKAIAIKVNFNNSWGYDDDDACIDALPQIINSIAAGLTKIRVQQEDIWVYDATRQIPDRFRQLISSAYSGIAFFDNSGARAGVQSSTFSSTASSARVDFSGTNYGCVQKLTDVLVNAAYLINIPIMKKHSSAGITLSLKNHIGSIDLFSSNCEDIHHYIDLDDSQYSPTSNPIVSINKNPNISDKTVLIIGDGLFGGASSNLNPPERWTSFNNGSPNMLFFAVDPVAVDSVMFDYLNRESIVANGSEDILRVAALAGLGVHERWNGNTTRKYSAINYIEIEGADSNPPDVGPPTSDPPGSNPPGSNPPGSNPLPNSGGDSGSSGGCLIQSLLYK